MSSSQLTFTSIFILFQKNKRLQSASILFLSLIWFICASLYAIKGDIFFHSDVARDYLVLEDIVRTHKPTLIGPRAGGVAGYFHGPLWFYLNLPIFILLNGNPSLIAWWYIGLVVVNIGMVYWVAKKLFSNSVAFLSSVLFALISLFYSLNMFNPYGAVLFSPIFFLSWCLYDRSSQFKFLLATFFLGGILIQFQIAFGGPLVFLVFIALLNKLRKTKKWWHLLGILILVVPLSTYLVFDLRHDWLQLRALLNVFNSSQPSDSSMLSVVLQRIRLLLGPSITLGNYMYSVGLSVRLTNIVSILLIGLSWFSNEGMNKKTVGWLMYFYLGFWIITIFFPGEIPNYYYWPFIPLFTIVVASGFQKKNKYVFLCLFALLISLNVFINAQLVSQVKGFVGEKDLSWKFYEKVARDTFSHSHDEFGYFVYTPDLYAYQPTYAMNFMAKLFRHKKSMYFQKKSQTFLIIAPAPGDRLISNYEYWKKEQVKIAKEPINVVYYPNGYVVEEYNFSEEDLLIAPDPNIVKGLFFR